MAGLTNRSHTSVVVNPAKAPRPPHSAIKTSKSERRTPCLGKGREEGCALSAAAAASSLCTDSHVIVLNTSKMPFSQVEVNDVSATTAEWLDVVVAFALEEEELPIVDLLLGNADGTLIFYKNTSSGAVPVFVFSSPNFQSIDIGNNSIPQIVDVNRDGKNDLLIGERSGVLNYFTNNSVGSNLLFNYNPQILEG